MTSRPSDISRRRLLVWGAAFGALAFAGGLVARVRVGGYTPSPTALRSLEPWQYAFVASAARRIARADREGVVSADEVDVAGFIDGYVSEMAPAVRADLKNLFAYIEHIAPLRSGHLKRFTELTGEAQDDVLKHLEQADETLLRGGFAGLKSLAFMGYYRDPRTWSILNYDGPTKNRPPGGWSR